MAGVVRPVLRWAGLAVLTGLAAVGAWSIQERLTDPRRLARLAVEDGSAARALGPVLAGKRLCARVLDAVEPFSMYGTSADLPSVRALAAAGLIEPVPEADRPAGARYPLVRMSAAATPFTVTEPFGDRRFVSLCYGRSKLVGIFLEGDGSLDPSPILRFTYAVVDRPAWADRPDIRAAFPFLDAMTADPIRARARVHFEGRRLEVEEVEIVPEMDVPDAIGGFGYCPPPGTPRQPGCRTEATEAAR